MEATAKKTNPDEDEEEYVLLDLDGGQIDIPANAPYDLYIGEYLETIGTCFVFCESDNAAVLHEELGPSEANLSAEKSTVDPNPASTKQVKLVAHLHKILKFRLLTEEKTDSDCNSKD